MTQDEPVRLLLAEDQVMIREALAALLSFEGDIEVVAQVGRGDEVLKAAEATKPDVAVLDIEMPGMDGLTAAAELKRRHPDIKIVILTTFGRPGFLRRAMESGVSAFLVKDSPADKLTQTIRRVLAGERVIDPDLAVAALADGVNPLTPRERDVLEASADGRRAWRLSADSAQVSYPRFSRDGARIAWTSWRDGNPEVYTADPDGSDAARLTYWSDARTRVTGWTREGEVLAVSATGQPETYLTWAYSVPLEGDPPRRLPFGPVTDLALEETGTALLAGRMNTEPAFWKRYRGGTRGKLWTATSTDPLFTRVLADLDGQLAGPMIIGSRLFFLSDHEGTGNIYSCALDGSDVRRHTDHDGMYARNPATDGQRIVYHVAG